MITTIAIVIIALALFPLAIGGVVAIAAILVRLLTGLFLVLWLPIAVPFGLAYAGACKLLGIEIDPYKKAKSLEEDSE